MAIIAPVPVGALPPAPDPNNRATFDALAYPWSAALDSPFRAQMNALAANVYANAQDVAFQAGTAVDAAATATTQADLAMGYRNTAGSYAATSTAQAGISTSAASVSTAKRDEAVAAAGQAIPAAAEAVSARDIAVAAAATAGAPLVASSTSSLTVGIATQALNVGVGKGFAPGQTVTIARTAAPATTWMRGTVLSYSSTGAGPLSVAVAEVAGAGTFGDWSISVAGNRGASSLTLPVVGVSVATTGASNVSYRLDSAVELKMPAAPNDGDFFAFANRSGAVPTINPNGKKIKGDPSILYLNTLNASACLKYDAANGDWVESFAGYTVMSVSSNAILLQPNTWAQKQTMQGYTVLGDDAAPAIKTKLITGVTAASQGGSTIVSLGGVDFRKIVGLQPIVRTSVASVPPNNSNSVGYQYFCSSDASGIGIYLSASNSGSILSTPFTVLVTYQE